MDGAFKAELQKCISCEKGMQCNTPPCVKCTQCPAGFYKSVKGIHLCLCVCVCVCVCVCMAYESIILSVSRPLFLSIERGYLLIAHMQNPEF